MVYYNPSLSSKNCLSDRLSLMSCAEDLEKKSLFYRANRVEESVESERMYEIM